MSLYFSLAEPQRFSLLRDAANQMGGLGSVLVRTRYAAAPVTLGLHFHYADAEGVRCFTLDELEEVNGTHHTHTLRLPALGEAEVVCISGTARRETARVSMSVEAYLADPGRPHDSNYRLTSIDVALLDAEGVPVLR
jgi:hypothetical protein